MDEKWPRISTPSPLASVPRRNRRCLMIGLGSNAGLCCRHTANWSEDDRRIDQNDLCVANSRCGRWQSVPNDCCHLDRLGILVPFDCRPVWSSSSQDHHCTVPCCCFPPPAWAQTPWSHQRGHRFPVRPKRENLGRGLLAGLRPWHRRVEPVRRPKSVHQYHVSQGRAAWNGSWFLFLPAGY